MAADAYTADEPSRAEVDAAAEPMVLEFGTNWCGVCRGAQPAIREALEGSQLKHVKIEDGPGRPLGRSFRVKLWPTLVFVQDGKEVSRVVRPANAQAVKDALEKLK